MDPITAIFLFLATPAGQVICDDLHKLGQDFAGLIQKIVQKAHDAHEKQ